MKLQTCQLLQGMEWNEQPNKLLDSNRTLILCFGSPSKDAVDTALAELSRNFPQSQIIGCSSAGEIFGDDVYDESLSVAIAQFEKTDLVEKFETISDDNNSFDAGKNLARQLNKDNLRSVLVLSDGLVVNGSQLIAGMTDELSRDIVITGGLAGDGDRFEKTWLINNDGMQHNKVCAIGFYGDSLQIGHGSRGGWDVLGPEREVTRAVDNVLYELDGQPALQLYKKYLGDRADGLPATGLLFPLAISTNDDVDDIVRTILAVSEEDNSITFAGDIPQGSYVRLMRANFDRLIDGAADAALAVNTDMFKQGPALSIAISCVGRRLVLGPRCDEELDAALNGLPENTQQIGFYSYGEISPLTDGRCDLHNQTMTLTLLWEDCD